MVSKSDHSLWWPSDRLRDRHWADPDGRLHTTRHGVVPQGRKGCCTPRRFAR